MKTTKLIVTIAIYLCLVYMGFYVRPFAEVLYGVELGALFAFSPLILALFCYKALYKASEIFISLFVKV